MNSVLVVCPKTRTFQIVSAQHADDYMNHKLFNEYLSSIDEPWVENRARLIYKAEIITGTIYLEGYANATALAIPGPAMQLTIDSQFFRINGYACFVVRDHLGRVHHFPSGALDVVKQLVSFNNPQYSPQQKQIKAMMSMNLFVV